MTTDPYFFDGLGSYAPGTVLVAFVVTAAVYALKKTKLKRYADNPWLKLLPFALGIIVYAIYHCLSKMTLECFLNETGIIVYQGFASGCLATVISAFVDKRSGKSKLSGSALYARKLLEGFIDDEHLEEVALSVADAVSSAYSWEDTQRVFAILSEYKSDQADVDANELSMLANLIVAMLKRTG